MFCFGETNAANFFNFLFLYRKLFLTSLLPVLFFIQDYSDVTINSCQKKKILLISQGLNSVITASKL